MNKEKEYVLLPCPRQINYLTGQYKPESSKPVVSVSINPKQVTEPQGYSLTVSPEQIQILAHDEAGAFYARQTLKQIYRQASDGQLKCLEIKDWPDFANRGVMLDISRDKVPTMDTLYYLIDMLAEFKINQFQLYTEHTFAYRNHKQVWEKASPMTAEQIRALDKYCKERFIELVPNQNSFGHMERWLKHGSYKKLAETPDGFDYCAEGFEFKMDAFSLSPAEPASLELLAELYAELLPNFSSSQFNIGCDETLELGMGRSKQKCEKLGKGRVYLEFLLKVYDLVKKHGRTMQFWGDIIVQYPELIKDLPPDIIALEWGYEANHPFAEDCEKFAKAGIPFYVCPGTSSWKSIAGRTDNMRANLLSAAENGLTWGALGYLNCDWGDAGHWQPLPVSFLGYAYGAALSWAVKANKDLDIKQAVDIHIFNDEAAVMGQLVYDLGNTYRQTDILLHCRTVLFDIINNGRLKNPVSIYHENFEGLSVEKLQKTIDYIDATISHVERAKMSRPDTELIKDELRMAAALLRHACQLGIARLGTKDGLTTSLPEDSCKPLAEDLKKIIDEHKRIWLLRNRKGGLEDSVGRMEKILRIYEGS